MKNNCSHKHQTLTPYVLHVYEYQDAFLTEHNFHKISSTGHLNFSFKLEELLINAHHLQVFGCVLYVNGKGTGEKVENYCIAHKIMESIVKFSL